MRRDPVVVAWVVGLGLAALVYLVGPDQFVFRLVDGVHVLLWRIGEALHELTATALDVVRALAIGLFVTFVALSVAVLRRGGRARGALVVVGIVFWLLVMDASPGDQTRWIAALCLSGVGAAVMTGRLREERVPVRV